MQEDEFLEEFLSLLVEEDSYTLNFSSLDRYHIQYQSTKYLNVDICFHMPTASTVSGGILLLFAAWWYREVW